MMLEIDKVISQLQSGDVTSRQLTEQCLSRIEQDTDQAQKVYLQLFADQALAQSDAIDQLKKQGITLSPLMGLPISVKDLIDIKGYTTSAGSTFIADIRAVTKNAPVVERLQAAGLIILGKTNLVEFAYSGVGINPHYGTPLNPYQREKQLVPGGSSSGAAVSVTDGMALGAIGSDTGGSCRIPASLCGLVGFKPTAERVPREGVFPLSHSLDSIGSLAESVNCCYLLDAILSGEEAPSLDPIDLTWVSFVVPEGYLLKKLDPHVETTFFEVLESLKRAGVTLQQEQLPAIDEVPQVSSKGGFAAAEAYYHHQQYLTEYADQYDQKVRSRIAVGEHISASDYQAMIDLRRSVQSLWAKDERFEAMILPTTPITARQIKSLATDEDFFSANGLYLRNTSVANVLDCPSISLPCHKNGTAPVGLMLIGKAGQDQRMFQLAKSIENVLS
jgi:aspartyl-tRNA(Asn)/glutamyl-tRNA(Gln) amidotransferase subunit A